ncbi:MAG TPA: bifunctional 5,10-methylene-tetrahydrofolate dehydrogenase/5,10-methylene-tetrahydrofolate cyclohydrolase [Proteiniclasticum sp.]|jgi:methylenetetrahydrofolate dehydrogenase (NADP+)/methenyltetrahydrofolate cyclohydrolase|uniref:bifunctional 5,10-methylenetetrahydrofolate dehydrogenase/5,10-methenyltetrahydrofolate cyclohydrolase n=1 Tax=Proteiniclasticum sp. TaxID=2053595 RepID=UPI000E850FCF|nr:bifunctional 5,10-methylenetetrahydrofolate dehydrogenase/5,10-methenyltetrahydrofolate cyclohydrolase [Proteiniclasticum sp.]HBW13425.1 bifunctional 5,10-methylene-tetrahydrofolate dehydrogenase/5,10-methylene-tetrahydrofolate cyclohydrolase [Proteiniclasticum sp.]
MAEIINVSAIAKTEKEKLKNRILTYKADGKPVPTLATVLVGEDPGSVYYLEMQKKNLEALGGTMLKITLAEDTSEEDLLSMIGELNGDDKVHGIMVLFPLPKHINEERVAESISKDKDVDGVNPINIGLLASTSGGVAPCTPSSVVEILKHIHGELKGKHAVIIGRSNIVGKPLIQLLLREHMTVTVCHSRTSNLPMMARSGEILISAIGRPLMIDEKYVSEGATVIDVGTSELDGKIVGDCDLESVLQKAAYATKVPGGVGTLTTTILMRTLLDLYDESFRK